MGLRADYTLQMNNKLKDIAIENIQNENKKKD